MTELRGVEELRIIAKDATGLKKADREALINAADELERAERCGATLFVQLCELRQRNEALTDHLAEMHRKHGAGLPLIFDSVGFTIEGPLVPGRGWTE